MHIHSSRETMTGMETTETLYPLGEQARLAAMKTRP